MVATALFVLLLASVDLRNALYMDDEKMSNNTNVKVKHMLFNSFST